MPSIYTIKLRRGIAADWTSINPVLSEGELGYELDTKYFKVGDGITPWNGLEYTVDADQYLPDAVGLPDGKILQTFAENWVITDPPSGLPDPVGVPDGQLLGILDETWVIVDPPAGGGGADPNAMLSSPAHLRYTYDTVAPSSPVDGDIWTDPSGTPPDPTAAIEAIVAAYMAAHFNPQNKDLRWYTNPAVTYNLLKEFRDDADLTGAVRVDSSTPSLGASQARMLVTRAGDSLSVLLDGATSQDAAGELHGYVWPRAGGLAIGEALEMHITYGGLTYNYTFLGPVVSDGVTYGAGNQAYFPIWGGGYNPNYQDALWSNWNTRGVFSDRPDGAMRMMNFIRIWRTAINTYVYQASTDGKTWITYGTRSLTITPTHIGFAAGQWGGTGKQIYSIDHLRVSVP